MKKTFLLSIALVFAFSIAAHSQVVVDIGHVESGEGTVYVPVHVDFSPEICAFDLFIDFDPGVLDFLGIANVTSIGDVIFANATNSQIHLEWADANGTVYEGVLLYLEFDNKGGDSSLAFAAETEIGDCDAMPIPIGDIVLSDGSVTTVPIPLSKFAFYLGLGLIVVFAVIKRGRIL